MRHKRRLISIGLAAIMLVSLCAVCASTGVSAVNGSNKASVKTTPDLVGSPIAAGTGPAACILDGSTSMYVFVKGYDSALWYRIWDTGTDGWTGGWASLGGKLTSSPAAASLGPDMEVFVRGTDGAVYWRTWDNGHWYPYYNLGGSLAPDTGPAACSNNITLDVFVEGTNGALYQKTFTQDNGWSSWASLGGKLTSSPAATTQAGMVVYVRGTDGAVYLKEYFLWGWSNWYNLGGQVAPGTGPAVCSYFITYGKDREDVFVEGTNGALYQKTWDGTSASWSSWQSLGGKLTASPTAATYTFNGAIDIEVFVRGTNGLIYQNEYYNGGWLSWTGFQGPP